MPTLNYTYDAKRPLEGEDVVAEQISATHRYYNQLVELHRGQTADIEALRLDHCPRLVDVERLVAEQDTAIGELLAEIKRRNAAARRKQPTKEDAATVKAARLHLATLRQERKELRAELRDNTTYQTALVAIIERYNGVPIPGADPVRRSGGLLKDARRDCCVYSGSYLRVEARVEAAMQRSFGVPRFRRWDGCGAVGPQIQGGLAAADLLKGNTHLRQESYQVRGKHKSPVAVFAVRVASDDRGKPVWCRLPVYLHRPLPDDAVIMWATVIRTAGPERRQSDGTWRPWYDWSLQLTIRTNAEHARAESGAVGIDLGWRKREDGLRVAYFVGDDGCEDELILPDRILARFDAAKELQGIRDKMFDAAIARLRQWMLEHESPAWLVEATEFVHAWKAHSRLTRLVDQWQPFHGDGEILPALREWREQEAGLWQREWGARRMAQRQRKKLYEGFAADMRRRYHDIIVEDCDWRKLAAKKRPEEDDGTQDAARHYQRAASVGMLRSCFQAAGATMSDAKDTTSLHWQCGEPLTGDRADLMLSCERCGDVIDQDSNAAHNLLQRRDIGGESAVTTSRDPEGDGSNGDAATVVVGGGRWARRKANRSQKASKTTAV